MSVDLSFLAAQPFNKPIGNYNDYKQMTYIKDGGGRNRGWE